jgi:hypothetical protein
MLRLVSMGGEEVYGIMSEHHQRVFVCASARQEGERDEGVVKEELRSE